MKTRIAFHRPEQIGGCITEIFTGKTRILIDYGEELPGSPNKEPFEFPWNKSQYAHPEEHPDADPNGRRVDAVLFTHYHGDHIGRLKDIPEKVPIYMSPLAKEVLVNIHGFLRDAAEARAGRDKSDKTKEWLRREQQVLDALGRARLFVPGEGRMMQPVGIGPVRQGGAADPGTAEPGAADPGIAEPNPAAPGAAAPLPDITVTPCRVDHSAAEACMFLIETPDKTILHTGDFRGHGFGAEEEGTAMQEDVARFAAKARNNKIDTLIIEGTMMSRLGEKPWSEEDLFGAAGQLFAGHRHVFLILSSTNFDSIRTFYRAARERNIPFYSGSRYIARQLKTLGRYAGLPELETVETADPKNPEQMARMRRDGFVVVIKGARKSSERLVNALCPCRPAIAYSMWMGYLTRRLDEELCEFVRFCREDKGLAVIPEPDGRQRADSSGGGEPAGRQRANSSAGGEPASRQHPGSGAGKEPAEGGAPRQWPPMHTSGHADPDLLAQVIKAADPGEVWPIHTEDAAGFLQLKLDPALKLRIRLGGYRWEEDHRALSEAALAKFREGGQLHNFVRLVKTHPELAFCLRGNSGNKAVIYYKNHAAFVISSTGHVSFDSGHGSFLSEEKQQLARQTLKSFGYSVEDGPGQGQAAGPVKIWSMPPEKAAGLSMGELEWLTGCIKCMIDSFFEGEKQKGKPLVEKEVQQALFHACKAQKNGYFFYDMEFSQPWGRRLDCTNKPDLMAVRFGPDGEPERLALVEVKSTPGALKGGSGLAEHIRGMESYPDWLLPVRGLDACHILEQYIALGLAGGPAGRYAGQEERFRALGMEVLLIFTGADTLAALDSMTEADPALLEGYAPAAAEFGHLAPALGLAPEEVRVCRKVCMPGGAK